MTQTLTTERLKQIASGDAFICTQDDESVAMARELLANREAQPVAEVVSKYGDPEAFGEREIRGLADLQKIPYDTKLFTAPPAPAVQKDVEAVVGLLESGERAEHCTKSEQGQRLESAITALIGITPPAPVVNPEFTGATAVPDFKALAENLVENLVDCGGADEKAVEQYLAFAEKTCRAAMLAQPVSQRYKLPDCVFVLLNHIEDVLDDEGWRRISVEKWNAVTMLAAAPEGGNEN